MENQTFVIYVYHAALSELDIYEYGDFGQATRRYNALLRDAVNVVITRDVRRHARDWVETDLMLVVRALVQSRGGQYDEDGSLVVDQRWIDEHVHLHTHGCPVFTPFGPVFIN